MLAVRRGMQEEEKIKCKAVSNQARIIHSACWASHHSTKNIMCYNVLNNRD